MEIFRFPLILKVPPDPKLRLAFTFASILQSSSTPPYCCTLYFTLPPSCKVLEHCCLTRILQSLQNPFMTVLPYPHLPKSLASESSFPSIVHNPEWRWLHLNFHPRSASCAPNDAIPNIDTDGFNLAAHHFQPLGAAHEPGTFRGWPRPQEPRSLSGELMPFGLEPLNRGPIEPAPSCRRSATSGHTEGSTSAHDG